MAEGACVAIRGVEEDTPEGVTGTKEEGTDFRRVMIEVHMVVDTETIGVATGEMFEEEEAAVMVIEDPEEVTEIVGVVNVIMIAGGVGNTAMPALSAMVCVGLLHGTRFTPWWLLYAHACCSFLFVCSEHSLQTCWLPSTEHEEKSIYH